MNIFILSKRIIRGIYNRFSILTNPTGYTLAIGIKIGKGVHFYAAIPGMFSSDPTLITIGDNIHIFTGCNFVPHDGDVWILRKDHPDLEITKPITIRKNVYFGINCTIMPGVPIGSSGIIGVGSVVTKNVPDNPVVANVTARIVKTVDENLKWVIFISLGYDELSAEQKGIVLNKHFGIKQLVTQ